MVSPAPTYTEWEQDIFHLQTLPDITYLLVSVVTIIIINSVHSNIHIINVIIHTSTNSTIIIAVYINTNIDTHNSNDSVVHMTSDITPI